MEIGLAVTEVQEASFRPLSWGLSFNHRLARCNADVRLAFSSPFLGTFFQSGEIRLIKDENGVVFVPFLGDFLSIRVYDKTWC